MRFDRELVVGDIPKDDTWKGGAYNIWDRSGHEPISITHAEKP